MRFDVIQEPAIIYPNAELLSDSKEEAPNFPVLSSLSERMNVRSLHSALPDESQPSQIFNIRRPETHQNAADLLHPTDSSTLRTSNPRISAYLNLFDNEDEGDFGSSPVLVPDNILTSCEGASARHANADERGSNVQAMRDLLHERQPLPYAASQGESAELNGHVKNGLTGAASTQRTEENGWQRWQPTQTQPDSLASLPTDEPANHFNAINLPSGASDLIDGSVEDAEEAIRSVLRDFELELANSSGVPSSAFPADDLEKGSDGSTSILSGPFAVTDQERVPSFTFPSIAEDQSSESESPRKYEHSDQHAVNADQEVNASVKGRSLSQHSTRSSTAIGSDRGLLPPESSSNSESEAVVNLVSSSFKEGLGTYGLQLYICIIYQNPSSCSLYWARWQNTVCASAFA